MLNQKSKPRKLLGIFGNQKWFLEFKTVIPTVKEHYSNETDRKSGINKPRGNKEEFLKYYSCSYIAFLFCGKRRCWGKGICGEKEEIGGCMNRNI